jgi:Cu+-exporting ATPase
MEHENITIENPHHSGTKLAEPTTQIIDLSIEGMTCASCVVRVEKAIRKLDGVEEVAVNLATNRARIKVQGPVDVAAITDRVERAGYQSSPVKDGPAEDQAAEEMEEYGRNFRLAAPLAGTVMVVSMVPMMIPAIERITMPWMDELNVLQMILTSIVMFISGRKFFITALRNARHRVADMNTLVAVGTGAAYIYSVLVTFGVLPGISSHEVYFDTAAVVIALILLGRWLESGAKSNASSAIRRLVRLAPKIAHRVSPMDHSNVIDVEIEFVRHGDLLLVKPGESVPVDGVVIEGASTVDESMMTGESVPVEKYIESEVIGGTINANGSFVMRAEGIGDETMLAQIVRTVEEAQSSKAPVQRLADAIAGVFVPVVMVISALTLVGWFFIGDANMAHALVNAVAVLVIACPCAMGLAVPTAIIAATGRGAERGILIRNAEALERAGSVDVVVFDKTGTLTHGKPGVVDLATFNGYDPDEVVRLAASVEALSEHPIAGSIVRHAKSNEIDLATVQEFRAAAGMGVYGIVDGHQVFVGRRSAIPGAESVDYTEPAGSSAIWVEIDTVVAGVFAVADTLKFGAREAIDRLRAMGIESVMLTGDSRNVANSIAAATGISRVVAEVLPTEKGDVIRELQREGKKVAMVGDGVNDAPALALADVSIAMATGTDIAISVSDITLIGGDIERVPMAIALSRRTVRVIRQNLFWAFIYNVIGIPLAALGFLSPILAGAAMAMSSVSVVSNSLRLKR